ncbi:MAG: DedA family protein [Alphaproteobacteria bacterium]|nr:DedA family protein [Alphaproteobacteria bacterium]
MHSSNATIQFLYDLIQNYGEWLAYAAVFIWTALEGETVVIVGGYIANPNVGVLNVYYLIASAWFGSFLGDQVYFYLGRRYGMRMLNRFPKWQKGVDKAVGLLNRYDVLFILSFRFIYGVRNVSSFSMGMSKIDWSRFAVLNFIAAGIWASSFAMLGYGFYSLLRSIRRAVGANLIQNIEIWVGLTVLAGFVGWLIWATRHRKHQPLEKIDDLSLVLGQKNLLDDPPPLSEQPTKRTNQTVTDSNRVPQKGSRKAASTDATDTKTKAKKAKVETTAKPKKKSP